MGFLRKVLGLGPTVDELIQNKDEDGLINLLQTSSNIAHRLQAISALGNFRSYKSLPALRSALQDRDPQIRKAARTSLQQIGYQPNLLERMGGVSNLLKHMGQIVSAIGSLFGLFTSTIALISVISGSPTTVSLEIPLISLDIGTISVKGSATAVDIFGLLINLGKWDLAGVAAIFILVGTPIITIGLGRIYSSIARQDSSCLVIALILPLWLFFIVLWLRAFVVPNYFLAIVLALVIVVVLIFIVSIPLSGGATGAALLGFVFTQLPMILIGLGVIAFIVWLIWILLKMFSGAG